MNDFLETIVTKIYLTNFEISGKIVGDGELLVSRPYMTRSSGKIMKDLYYMDNLGETLEVLCRLNKN